MPTVPRRNADDRDAVRERRTRALEEPLDVRLVAREPFLRLEVRNPLHGTAYLVLMPGYPRAGVALCTCTDFARRDLGTCKHVEAATRWLPAHPDARPLGGRVEAVDFPAVWAEVDRQVGALTARSTARAIRAAGQVLVRA